MQTLESMIAGSVWARTLTAEQLDEVLRAAHERKLPADGHAMRCGEPADAWFGVIEGVIKMSVSQPEGKTSTFTGVTAGGWAGEGSLLKNGPWGYDGIAMRPTRVAVVPRPVFERLVHTSLPFNRFLLDQMNARLSLFIGLVECNRLLGPDARVARGLASLFDPLLYPRTSRFVELSQEEIGLLAHVSRQRTNRALHKLQAYGLLRVEFGGVSVIDVDGLRRYRETDGTAPPDSAAAPRPGAQTTSHKPPDWRISSST